MASIAPRPCPQCGRPFLPRRKNQDYCSTECRVDHNNELAKARYTLYKEEAPQLKALQAELQQLKRYLASLTIILLDIQEVDSDLIRHQGQLYKRDTKVGRTELSLYLPAGGAIQLPGGQIIHRSKGSYTSDNCWRYVLLA